MSPMQHVFFRQNTNLAVDPTTTTALLKFGMTVLRLSQHLVKVRGRLQSGLVEKRLPVTSETTTVFTKS